MARLSDLPDLVGFIDHEEAMTIAVPIDEQGTVHAAALLYAYTLDPLKFYFVTARDSEKCHMFKYRKELSCGAVIGAVRGIPYSIQLRGKLRFADPAKHEKVLKQYYRRRGDRHEDIDDPKNVLLEYEPDWGRYTDYGKGYQKRQLEL